MATAPSMAAVVTGTVTQFWPDAGENVRPAAVWSPAHSADVVYVLVPNATLAIEVPWSATAGPEPVVV